MICSLQSEIFGGLTALMFNSAACLVAFVLLSIVMLTLGLFFF